MCFLSQVRWPREKVGNELPPVAPDLVVEVFSPSNRPGEMRKKVNEYLDTGTPMVWVVYPERKIVAIHRPDDRLRSYLMNRNRSKTSPSFPVSVAAVADFFR